VIDYAAEYGIDMDELWQEHPAHPSQARLQRAHSVKAEAYQDHVRAVAEQANSGIEAHLSRLRLDSDELDKAEKHLLRMRAREIVVPGPTKKPETLKNIRRKYVFTDEHLKQANLAYDRLIAEKIAQQTKSTQPE
jgi:hypothetical protein